MALDKRKIKILQAVIKNYLESGEPVGSRTIAKYSDINLSPATIRNEMVDLEELGYIMQPYTSAGRIPSDKGYRLYVDLMLEDKIQEVENMKSMLIDKADKMENLFKQIARLLAIDTNYTTMVSSPQYVKEIKFIQITELDSKQLLTVVVMSGNLVKNKIINTEIDLDRESVLKLNILMNSYLQGRVLSNINVPLIAQIRQQAGEYETVAIQIIDAIASILLAAEDIELYTSGATNILRYPELSDSQTAANIIYTIEEKKVLTEFIQDKLEDEDSRGIQVYIGNETPVQSMQDCSVVTATYEIEEGVYGKIGIIGPKRMDYDKVVNTLKNLMVQLDDIFKDKT